MKIASPIAACILGFTSIAVAQSGAANSPLLECTIEAEVRVLRTTTPPLDTGGYRSTFAGFVVDTATGTVRLRRREGMRLDPPMRWQITQREPAVFPWIAIRMDDFLPRLEFMQIRLAPFDFGRFAYLTANGSLLTGSCR